MHVSKSLIHKALKGEWKENHKDKIGKINNDLWCTLYKKTKKKNHKTFKLNIGKMCAYVDSSPGEEPKKGENWENSISDWEQIEFPEDVFCNFEFSPKP